MDYVQELDPISKSTVKIRLYRNIRNISELCEKMKTLPCILMKASLILDPFQIVVAANRAVTISKMVTHTIYSETLFNLSIQNNITQSFKTFGIHPKWDGDILVVLINTVDNDNSEVFKEIDGDHIDIKCLSESRNEKDIKKLYKLSDKEGVNIDSIVTKIACKECL